jgi:hypothetical protein
MILTWKNLSSAVLMATAPNPGAYKVPEFARG